MNIHTHRQSLNHSLQPECSLALQRWDQQLNALQLRLGVKHIKQPYYFFLGAEAAGKSSIFSQKFNFPLQSLDSKTSDTLIYYHQKKIIFNVPGAYLHTDFHTIWPAMMRRLHRVCKEKMPAGVFLVVNMQQWLTQNREEQQRFIADVSHCLHVLADKEKQTLPLSLLITHVDHLYGFNACFSSLNDQARQQPCGLYLNVPVHHPELETRYQQASQQLLSQLQRFCLTRIQQERLLTKQIVIKQFPLQLDVLQTRIWPLIQQLSSTLKPCFHWDWISVISNQQTETSIDLLTPAWEKIFPAQPETTRPSSPTQQHYFSADLLTDYFHEEKAAFKKQTSLQQTVRYVSYAGAAALTLMGSLYLTNYFGQQMQGLNQTDFALQQFRFQTVASKTPLTLSQLIRGLNNLQAAAAQLADIQPRSQLNQKMQQLLTHYLQTRWLPAMARLIENALIEQKQQASNELYDVLKAYLMLGEPQYLELSFLTTTLARYFPPDTKALPTNLWRPLLQRALKQGQPIPLNTALIQEARDTLINLPQPLRAYLNVKNVNANQVVKIKIDNQVLQLPIANFEIPKLYTRAEFKAIYEKKINAASIATLESDWVLGTTHETMNNRQLMEQVQSLYLADYATWWNLLLFKTTLAPLTDLKQAENIVTRLSADNSPLLILIQLVSDNTQPLSGDNAALQTFNKTVAKQFSAIHALSQGTPQQLVTLTAVRQNFKNLARLLHDLNNKKNTDHVAFLIARDFFANPQRDNPIHALMTQAQQLPPPLNNWITDVAQAAWKLILQSANRDITAAWQTHVLPFYKKSIAGRYPLDKKATTDIALDDFNQFFADNGMLAKFFTQYLADFIDTSSSEWKLKILYGASLNLSTDTLQQFERAHVIRTMFFPGKSATAKMSFELKPILFEPIVRKIVFTLDTQKLEDRQNSQKSLVFHWPGNVKSHQTQLEFTNIDGKYSATERNGPWGLFRLFDFANLEQTKDPRRYQLIFDLNGSAAKYTLTAQTAINPFMPNIIEHFRAPTTVTVTD